MILDLDQHVGLSWKPTPQGPQTLRSLYLGTGSVPAGYVTLSPGAETVLVRRVRQNAEGHCTCIDTTRWKIRWSIALPPFEGRDVGCSFLTSERYIIAAREVSLWQASDLVWKTELPSPSEFQVDGTPLFPYPQENDWLLLSCSDPTFDDGLVYVRANWAKRLASTGYFDPEWADRTSVEILSLRDGQWLRREQVPSDHPPVDTAPAARYVSRLIKSGGIELLDNGLSLGVLEPADDLTIVDADISMSDRRLVATLADERFAFFEIVDRS